jgi:hypothetical protein
MLNGKPMAIDLFCGLGGWAEGFLAEGYEVIGFDIERRPYPGQLVIQDVLTLNGSQFRNAAVIVASPPCQNYSYLAMPWSRSPDWARPDGDGWQVLNSVAAKEMREKWQREGPDNRLFDACFRIQREAIEARRKTGKCWCEPGDQCPECFIPLIVENVRGAIPWVGRSAWNYGSFHLWGDVPALMPINLKRRLKSRIDCGPRLFSDRVAATPEEAHALHYRIPVNEGTKRNPDGTEHQRGSWFRIADSSQGDRGQKVPVYSDPRRNGGKGVHLTSPHENETGVKQDAGNGGWFSKEARHGGSSARFASSSNARKMASAQIAKIPFELASWIARIYYPKT